MMFVVDVWFFKFIRFLSDQINFLSDLVMTSHTHAFETNLLSLSSNPDIRLVLSHSKISCETGDGTVGRLFTR